MSGRSTRSAFAALLLLMAGCGCKDHSTPTKKESLSVAVWNIVRNAESDKRAHERFQLLLKPRAEEWSLNRGHIHLSTDVTIRADSFEIRDGSSGQSELLEMPRGFVFIPLVGRVPLVAGVRGAQPRSLKEMQDLGLVVRLDDDTVLWADFGLGDGGEVFVIRRL